jgi:light-regulated signal transduction histidine kinase (bacteriophytochrome)
MPDNRSSHSVWIAAGLAAAFAVGDVIGILEARPPAASGKVYHITLNLFHRATNFNFTTTALGVAVFFTLAILILAAVLFGLAAWAQAIRIAHANRELTQEIAERKRAEQALRQANEELRQFAYVAAHDLQEPLRNVRTSLGILTRRCGAALDAEAQELVGDSIHSAKRLHGMVKDLLGLATITEHLAAPDGKVDANRVVREVLHTFQPEISERRAQVVSGELPALRVHENHLFQLFHNLIGNALKYARPDVPPSITIGSERRESAWSFFVRDNGIGFDPKFSEEIFTIFRRLHQRHEYPGNGMGLAICSKIVSAYGGSIQAEGRPNEGAVFQFTLPCGEPES